MSGSRQRVTGTIRFFSIYWVGLVVLIWFLPDILTLLFPQALVSLEPWLMTPDDLNWKRSLLNVVTKPGFRILTVSGVCAGCWLMTLLVRQEKLIQRIHAHVGESSEWMIDGWAQSSLSEYGHWVGVVK